MKSKKFKTGGFVDSKKTKALNVAQCGCSLVARSQYEKYGAALLRKINNAPCQELIVVDDDRLERMSLSEKVALLNSATPLG